MTLEQLESIWKKSVEKCTYSDFVKAIRVAVLEGSLVPLQLLGILERYEKELQPQMQSCLTGNGNVNGDRSLVTFYGQLLASEMILLFKSNTNKLLRTKMIEFLEVSSAVVKSDYDFIGKAIDTLSYDFKELGYDWSNVESSTSLDLLAYRICTKSRMNTGVRHTFEFNGAGQACISDGILQIKSSRGEAASVKAFDINNDRVQVFTKNTRSERLKASVADTADKIDEFARTFAETQNETLKSSPTLRTNKLKVGEKVTIKCLDIYRNEDGYQVIKCAALNSPDMAEGCILDEELIKGIYTEDLAEYLFAGDCIENAIVIENGDEPVFSIKDAYSEYSRNKAWEDNRKSAVFEAKAVAVRDDIGKINWLTSGGYGAISLNIDGIDKGDIAVLNIHNIQKNNLELFINVCPPRYECTSVDRKFDEDTVLADFVVDSEKALENIRKKEDDKKISYLDKSILTRLSKIIARRNSNANSLEIYKRLLCSEFIARLSGDAEGVKTYEAQATYLGKCIEYAQSGAVSDFPKSGILSEDQSRILDILANSGNQENVSSLAAKFTPGDLSTSANKILSLLISLETSRKYTDAITTTQDKVRKAICGILEVSDEFRAEEAIVMGKYGKGEGHKLEFKSSYVMRNDGKGPDIDYQGRGQVFEAVCGFLNSDGGTVYIGVNDKTGDPIISDNYGIKGDIRWLTENYSSIDSQRYRQLGHHIPKADSLDHFVLFLNAEKEIYFKQSLQKNITIEVTEDQDAIRITVSPSQYEIAFLYKDLNREDGIAYMRDGNSTVPMTSHDMEQRLMSLKSIKKEMGFIVKLQEAIDKKHKVILKDYASGNSGTIRDRFVVPVNLFYNDENVYCWDLEEAAFKQFRLSRIGSIETDIEDPVYSHAFEPREADIFRWINEDESYHIKIRMEVGARNYLIEEYSNAKNLSENELYEESDGKWILDTRLQGLGAMRRFFLGLADKIEILPTEDSEKLQNDIRKYVAQNLDDYIK